MANNAEEGAVPAPAGLEAVLVEVRQATQPIMEALTELRRHSDFLTEKVVQLERENRTLRVELQARQPAAPAPDVPAGGAPAQRRLDEDRPEWLNLLTMRERKPPSYAGASGQHPVKFLGELEEYFEECRVPYGRRVSTAVSCLGGKLEEWGLVFKDRWEDYGQFRRQFLTEFWSSTQQEEVRRKITIGHWDRRDGTMTEHFIRLVNQARYLDPPLAEGQLITALARHYPPEIERSVWTAGIADVPAAITFLRRMDGTTSRPARRAETTESPSVHNTAARPVEAASRPTENAPPQQPPAQQRDRRPSENRNENWRSNSNPGPRREDHWRDRRPENLGPRSPHPYNTRQNRQINAITVEDREDQEEEEGRVPEASGNEEELRSTGSEA